MDNRLIEYIKKGIDKGENLFFEYGNYIHDWYLYDLYTGVCDANGTYKKYFLTEINYDYYIHCIKDNVSVFNISNECTDELFSGKATENDDSDGMSEDNLESSNKTEDSKRASDTAESISNGVNTNKWIRMVELCKNTPDKKFAIFCEDYEWITGLYKSSNDDDLIYIKYVKELSLLKNVVIIISIEDIEMLSKYHFEFNKNNNFMVNSPSEEEVYLIYLRRYMKKYAENKKFNENFLIKLREIAQGVAAGEKSLKNTLRIFDRIMKQTNGEINKKDFETALDKIIEEKVTLADVIIDDNKKEEINERVEKFLKSDDNDMKAKGLILTGPPGTGKTFLVKALANEKNCYFMSPSLADLKGEYVGQTSPKVKRLFQQARANAPTIIFIDEADTIFPDRNLSGTGNSDSFNLDMVNQFLVEIDGLKTGENKVFVVAATNRVNILDSAIKSRLGDPIEIPLPDKEKRKEMFTKKLLSKDFIFENFNFTDEFLNKTNHMSGRDIDRFIKALNESAAIKGKNLSDYKEEIETKELFFDTLSKVERTLVKDLSAKLGIEIKEPTDYLKYENIIGYKYIKDEIDNQIKIFDIKERKEQEHFGIKPKKGILLYGPPGNAKSKLAEAAANENNLYFIKITSDTFKVHPDELNNILINIFDSAFRLSEMCTKQKGVLLFFDEFDSIASSQLLDPRVRGTLLTQLDSTDTLRNPKSHVLFIAATNFYERLDDATIRAGRIDVKLKMDNPTEEDAKTMIRNFISENPQVDTTSLDNKINSKVDNKEISVIEEIYKRYKNDYTKKYMQKYIKSFEEATLLTPINEEIVKKAAETKTKDLRPSGADLRTLSNNLIETAYRLKKFGTSDMLKIDKDVIENTLCERSNSI